uniref:Uncharacterized protein n=1 Tax=Arundo donax TaxID=35708 RepID=A0A0A9H585_ARUDO
MCADIFALLVGHHHRQSPIVRDEIAEES